MTMPAPYTPPDVETERLAAAKARAAAAEERFAKAERVFSPTWLSVSAVDPRRLEHAAAFEAKQKADAALFELERNAAARPQEKTPREALADAVARLKAARTELTAARDAKAASAAAVAEARHVVSETESGIKRTRQQAAAANGDPGEAAAAIAQGRAMLAAAKEYLGIATDRDSGLEIRVKRAEDSVAICEVRVNRTRGAYLRDLPAVIQLVQRYDYLQRELLGVGQVLDLVETAGGLSANWRVRVPAPEIVPQGIKQLAMQWRSALAALESDVDSALPS
jgi:hypothetical protein